MVRRINLDLTLAIIGFGHGNLGAERRHHELQQVERTAGPPNGEQERAVWLKALLDM